MTLSVIGILSFHFLQQLHNALLKVCPHDVRNCNNCNIYRHKCIPNIGSAPSEAVLSSELSSNVEITGYKYLLPSLEHVNQPKIHFKVTSDSLRLSGANNESFGTGHSFNFLVVDVLFLNKAYEVLSVVGACLLVDVTFTNNARCGDKENLRVHCSHFHRGFQKMAAENTFNLQDALIFSNTSKRNIPPYCQRWALISLKHSELS